MVSRYCICCYCIHCCPIAARKESSIVHYGDFFDFNSFIKYYSKTSGFLTFSSWGFTIVNFYTHQQSYAQTKLTPSSLIDFNIWTIIVMIAWTTISCIKIFFVDSENTLKAYIYITIFLVDFLNLRVT